MSAGLERNASWGPACGRMACCCASAGLTTVSRQVDDDGALQVHLRPVVEQLLVLREDFERLGLVPALDLLQAPDVLASLSTAFEELLDLDAGDRLGDAVRPL